MKLVPHLHLGSSSSEDEFEVESPPKKHCTRLSTPTSAKKRAKHRSSRKYNYEMGERFVSGSNTMRTAKVPSARSAGSLGSHFSEEGSMGYQTIYKLEESCREDESLRDLHSQVNLTALAAEGALREDSIMQQ